MLQAYARIMPQDWNTAEFEGLARLPHFNPDEDREGVHFEVAKWRQAVADADAVVISTPEYAHALPGAFKNGLDWLVSDPAFAQKRVVIIKAERGTDFATESLKEVLRTMSANIVEDACVSLSLATNSIGPEQILARQDLRSRLELSVENLKKSF
jgi:NAD(P)H-dependent FMN reductase